MSRTELISRLDQLNGMLPLDPQLVGRFYGDFNRLGQRPANSPRPPFFKPERWIASSTEAVNPPGIPGGGLSTCAEMSEFGQAPVTLKELLADEALGPRLLGSDRYAAHGGRFLVLIKILDPKFPIPFHVHANDEFVRNNPHIYPNEQFGKDEAYYFLEAPKGSNPYTHIGLHAGVTVKDIITAMRFGEDHVLELSPCAYQRLGGGFHVPAGVLHRPGTALTLEIQQPSDVYTMLQHNFGSESLDPATLHPGFASIEEAAEAVITLEANLKNDLLANCQLKPLPVRPAVSGGAAEWIYPPEINPKFSGMRLSIETAMDLYFDEPAVLFVWQGGGEMRGHALTGRRGHADTADDEFFISHRAFRDSGAVTIRNTGNEPLIAFLLFAATVEKP